MESIKVHNIVREFDDQEVVKGLTFKVDEGEIFGLLGPNGAGKTTTLRMLTGRLRPTSGKAWVAGYDVVSERQSLKPQIGVVFEYQNIYERLSGRDNLRFSARLYGVNRKRVEEVLVQVGLMDKAKVKTKKYSNGMKQRLLIARALLHEPRVLFFDEPTRGLDPNVARAIREIVIAMADSVGSERRYGFYDDTLYGGVRPAVQPGGHHRPGVDRRTGFARESQNPAGSGHTGRSVCPINRPLSRSREQWQWLPLGFTATACVLSGRLLQKILSTR